MRRELVILFFGVLSLRSEAFIRSVTQYVGEVVEGRKPGKGIEFVLRHRIETKPGQAAEVEERIVFDRGHATLFFKVPGVAPFISVSVESRGYVFDYGKIWSRRSHVFYRALLASSSDELLDLLLAENFVRRDQLMQYKPGFQPTGDPNLWEIRDNYLRHDDVYLHRVGKAVSVAVAGETAEGKRRVVYFDRERTIPTEHCRGIRRFEWTDGQDTVAWNFDQFLKSPPLGEQPHKMSFEVNGVERISTDVVQIRPLSDHQLSELYRLPRLAKGGSVPPAVEEILGLLLSYR